MKFHLLGFAALTGFGLIKASHVHIDVDLDISSQGEVAVKIGPKQRQRILESGKPVYPSRKTSRVLAENQVDLGYEIHEGFPASGNVNYLAFRNIPYAEPPVGELRFFEPVPPSSYSDEINNGSISRVCPQMQVGWVPEAFKFLQDFAKDDEDLTNWKTPINPEDYGDMLTPPDGISEDCLLLDVMVPNSVWENRNSRRIGAAVVVWIHGGGFIYGWKDQYGKPDGLLQVAQDTNEQNIIYVAMNYRLGAFGWLGGKKYQDDGGVSNIGLLDQELALQWVQRNIASFGGSPDRISVMGQSAGASSILHHITARGGNSPRPVFRSAILQSPGFFPQPNPAQDDSTYTRFLNLTGVNDFEALLALDKDADVLIRANADMTWQSNYGYFNFGPTVDGTFVPKLPSKLLLDGGFHKNIAMFLGYTKFDGLLFTPPWIRTIWGLQGHIRKLFPGVPQSVLNYVAFKYPIVPPARLEILGVADFMDDIAIQCNAQYLTEAVLSTVSVFAPIFRYVFNALPALHGYDTGYTYFPSPPLMTTVNETLAKFWQNSIVNFARYFDPNPEDSDFWPVYTKDDRRVMNFGAPGQSKEPNYEWSLGADKLNKDKCDYWQSAPYFPEPGSSEAEFDIQDAGDREELKRM